MKKVRGSSSAFQWGSLVLTRYASGCHRSILLQSQGVRDESIDPKHLIRGTFNEELYERSLVEQNHAYIREESVSESIPGYDDTVFVGRLDFRVHMGTADERIDELKSTESSTVLNEIIKKGHYKLENLAQLISYMVSKRLQQGRLIYTHFKIDKNNPKVYLKNAERAFSVVIDDSGSILVDNKDSLMRVEDQLNHRQTAAKCINNMLVWCRPYKSNDFDGPCKFCKFAPVCNRFDAGFIDTTEQFVDEARNVINNVKR